jgi:hypothetical protein
MISESAVQTLHGTEKANRTSCLPWPVTYVTGLSIYKIHTDKFQIIPIALLGLNLTLNLLPI